MNIEDRCLGLDRSSTVNAINWALSFFAISIAHSAAFIDSSDPSIATRILESLPATVVVDPVKAIFYNTIITIKSIMMGIYFWSYNLPLDNCIYIYLLNNGLLIIQIAVAIFKKREIKII